MKYIIYKLIFPNGKIYIGQTKQKFNKRMNQYKYDSYSKKRIVYNYLVYRAIRKYDWNNIKKEIILYCEETQADYYEREFIKLYKSNDRNFGYNIESGGNKNKHLSKDTIEKLSGKNHPFYGKKRIEHSKRMSGKNHPFYGKKRIEMCGENNPSSKLTNIQRNKIKYLFNNKIKSAIELSKIYNISRAMIYRIF